MTLSGIQFGKCRQVPMKEKQNRSQMGGEGKEASLFPTFHNKFWSSAQIKNS